MKSARESAPRLPDLRICGTCQYPASRSEPVLSHSASSKLGALKRPSVDLLRVAAEPER